MLDVMQAAQDFFVTAPLLPLEQKLEQLLSSGDTTKKPNARLAWASPLRAGRTWCPI